MCGKLIFFNKFVFCGLVGFFGVWFLFGGVGCLFVWFGFLLVLLLNTVNSILEATPGKPCKALFCS